MLQIFFAQSRLIFRIYSLGSVDLGFFRWNLDSVRWRSEFFFFRVWNAGTFRIFEEIGVFELREGRRMMNGNSYHHHRQISENLLDRFSDDVNRSTSDGFATIPASSSSLSSSPTPSYSSSSCSGLNYIEHRVSKMDTLAGVAIKYGVEVADIRRMNGLVTDLQMFALEILRIPCPGRHPPSPIVSNGTNGSATNGKYTPPRHPQDDVLNSIQSLKLKPPRRVTPAMSSLRGYYGLAPPQRGPLVEGTEMAVYKTGRSVCLEDEARTRASPASDPGFSLYRKSRSLVSLETAEANTENEAVAEAGDSNDPDRSIRRRQKPDNGPSMQTPERKEDGGGGFLGRIGKGLTLRPKTGSKMDGDARQSSSHIGVFFSDVFVSVRKSRSTSNLQESENASSIWPTSKWSLKPDAIPRPIFDGFPMPMIVRRNKAALD